MVVSFLRAQLHITNRMICLTNNYLHFSFSGLKLFYPFLHALVINLTPHYFITLCNKYETILSDALEAYLVWLISVGKPVVFLLFENSIKMFT